MSTLSTNDWQPKLKRSIMGALGLILIAAAWNCAADAHSGLVVAPIWSHP